MRTIAAFFLRNAALYVMLFAAIAFYVFAWPAIRGELSSATVCAQTR